MNQYTFWKMDPDEPSLPWVYIQEVHADSMEQAETMIQEAGTLSGYGSTEIIVTITK